MSQFNVEPEINQGLKHLSRVLEMERRYDLLMPIDPNYDPALCRDEFLRKLFKELDLPENEKLNFDSSRESLQSVFSLPSRYSDTMSLSSFMRRAPTIIKTTRLMDRGQSKTFTEESFKISVLSGQTDHYGELLESIKRSALYFMFSRVLNRLRIMEKISLDWGKIELNTLPHMIFSWSMSEFFKRCMLPDSLYLEVLQLNHSEESLDWAKFSSDILEIIRYYKFFYTETFLNKGHKTMLTIIGDQQQLLKIDEQLDKTLEISKRDFARIVENSRKISDAWWGQHRRNLVKACRRHTMEATVLLPIQWRYVRDYFATMTEMQILKDNMTVEKLRKQIKELNQQILDDENSTNQAILVYTLLVENYQQRIANFSNKLTTELAHWEDENLIAANRLNRAIEDYKNIEDKIEYMQRRVGEVQEERRVDRQAQIDRVHTIYKQQSKHVGIADTKAPKKHKKPAKKARATRRFNIKA